ncbi:MAG: SusC/RagA family TonB-linked outer membrane protein, partial [Bacteroidales bacterium]
MKKIKLIGLLILTAVFCMYSFADINAQAGRIATQTITSQVLNENGEPMANVVVSSFKAKGNVLTAPDGSFSILVTQDVPDHIVVDVDGFETAVVPVGAGVLNIEPITLKKKKSLDPKNVALLPYMNITSDRSVGAVSTITGEELSSYPTGSMLTALSGRLPGLVVSQTSHIPGQESVYATIRGNLATIYIDGIMRDPVGLSLAEVERIDLLKDLPGRSQLGINGENPVIWITTKKGTPFVTKINFSSEYGLHSPTVLPEYLDAYNYAMLYNEALENDGLSPVYTQTALNAYRDGTDPLRYPNINWYDRYVAKTAPFRKADLSFSGGDNKVSYYSNFHYHGHNGLETTGEDLRSNLYQLRAKADIELNDFIRLDVNILGSYEKQRFANDGSGGSFYNYFNTLSSYPFNANPLYFGDLMITSADYPVNLDNEFLYTGFAEYININTQNNARLTIDLGNVLEGLTFVGTAAIDAYNIVANNKGGTAALYRLQTTSGGADTAVLITPESIVASMSSSYNYVKRRTAFSSGLNYNYTSGDHELTANAVYYMGLDEIRAVDDDYQPLKMQDFVVSANYAYDGKYVLQADLAYTGSMKMSKGERFSIFPTVGAAWILTNESFMDQSNIFDYLKLYSSFGIMGVNDFSLGGYNTFYLHETLWRGAGSWRTGYTGNYSSYVNIYNIVQEGALDFRLPKKRYFNLGLQGTILDKALSFEVNYFNNLYYDKISNLAMTTPSLIGSSSFLPAVNFGKDMRWGLDGMLQYSGQSGDFTYSAGLNATYQRAKYLEYDEPEALPEYRKRSGKDMDLFWIYQADGLFQSQSQIDNHTVYQSWGELAPGDIRYVDYNEDGLIDEADIHTTGAHSPRIFYGINLSAGYKGFNIFALGQGIADGNVMLSSSRYFRINGTRQNYSEFLLDRFPETNNVPRLTTQSTNNTQNSTFWLASAAYFRLRNVELSYTLPTRIAFGMKMQAMKVFLRGTNLLVVSELNKYSVEPDDM